MGFPTLKEEFSLSSSSSRAFSRLGIQNIRDLLYYFPRRYVDRSKILNWREISPGDSVSFIGKVIYKDILFGRRRRLEVRVEYQGFSIYLIFFHAIPYFQKALRIGEKYAFWGNISSMRGKISLIHPEFEPIEEELLHVGRIVPLYRITEGLRKEGMSIRKLREMIHHVIKKYSSFIQDPLPQEILKQYGFYSLKEALERIHFPSSEEEKEKARERLSLNEFLLFLSLVGEIKSRRLKWKKSFSLKEDLTWSKKVEKELPFTLTSSQKEVLKKLFLLAKRDSSFSALLQGDVGSGKTVVALLSALWYIESGLQVAWMAPTEILARQHYQTILSFLSPLPFIQIELLLGQEPRKKREEKLRRLSQGETHLIIGTHSLIQPDITFKNLGYVIIDEQHRFGVEQREALLKKGKTPDFLSMSATPIPRSLALTIYADTELLTLKEKPPGRKPVITKLFHERDLPRIYRAMKSYLNQGYQAYIIYPLIEESEKVEWASLQKEYGYLEKKVFPEFSLGLLHGRLSSEEKERVMQRFKEKEIHILVSTTVVEVGVDVPSANIMVIRNAEKFGLSQLHQLRGRIGRGETQAFCILVMSKNTTPEGEKRLEAMLYSDDGFYLAQKDLEFRGPGEIIGKRQSGASEFQIADLRKDFPLVEMAEEILKKYPHLKKEFLSPSSWVYIPRWIKVHKKSFSHIERILKA